MKHEAAHARQQRILAFVTEYIDANQIPPTVREIQAGCEVSSTSTVNYHLNQLNERGLIKRIPKAARGLVVVRGE